MYEIIKESRENHPTQMKACLYYNGRKLAVAKDGKVTLKDKYAHVPSEWLNELAKVGDEIIRDELNALKTP